MSERSHQVLCTFSRVTPAAGQSDAETNTSEMWFWRNEQNAQSYRYKCGKNRLTQTLTQLCRGRSRMNSSPVYGHGLQQSTSKSLIRFFKNYFNRRAEPKSHTGQQRVRGATIVLSKTPHSTASRSKCNHIKHEVQSESCSEYFSYFFKFDQSYRTEDETVVSRW